MNDLNSEVSGFYKLSLEERQKFLIEQFKLNTEEVNVLQNLGYFKTSEFDLLIENTIGSFQLPIGIACNFKINDKDYLIPMVTEEPSVVAGASNAARIARKLGGFISFPVKSIMISQIQITNLAVDNNIIEDLYNNKEKIIKIANEQDPTLIKLGGGVKDIKIRAITSRKGLMLVVHLHIDVKDAMGANICNTMAEAVAPYIEEISGGKVNLKILTNLAMQRIARSHAVFDKDLLGGEDVVELILDAYEFAFSDPFRAATHNKGIMNGITALALATGNDTRAIEVGAHAYASLVGRYLPLTKFEKDTSGNLIGEIEIPITLGIVGGMINAHPMAKLSLKILNVKTSEELCQVAAAVGLSQNVAALRALVTEGIQEGHMKLHARKVDLNK